MPHIRLDTQENMMLAIKAVFDEYDYTKELGHAFRRKSASLRIEDIKYSELLFNKDLKVIQDNTTIKLLSNNQEIISLKYVNYKIHNLNILYLDSTFKDFNLFPFE